MSKALVQSCGAASIQMERVVNVMSRSISSAEASSEVRFSDVPRPAPAKADLRSDLVGLPFEQVTRDAIIRYYGSVKAAAISLGNVDPSLMQREFAEGNFKRFYKHGTFEAKAFVAAQLNESYGPLNSREARIQQLKRLIEDSVAEMAALAVTA